MGSAAGELDDLRAATDHVVSRAVSDLVAASADSPSGSAAAACAQLVVVGPGEHREFNAVGPVSFASFGPDVTIPALVGDQPSDRGLPTPLMVARYLASRDLAAHPEHADVWACARWMTTSGDDASVLGSQLGADETPVALILVADGAACHGPKAPRAQDSRAKPYDDGVWAALESGRPARLDGIDLALGVELGASGAQVWPVLVAAAGGHRADGTLWDGTVLWTGAPYGVGWAVAAWR